MPATTAEDVYYSYDLLGRRSSTRFGSSSGVGITNTSYNKAGQVTSITSHGRSMSYQYDSAGRRSRMTWPDNFYVTYSYDTLSRVTAIREYGAGSGIGVLASFTYDDLGRPTTMGRGNGADSTYAYDALSRLSSLGHQLSGTSNDYSANFTYSPASRIASRDSINDGVYRWTGSNGVKNYLYNAVNQITIADGANITHDLDGNLTGDGVTTYTYDSENKLRTVRGSPGQLDLTYDPFGRLRQTEVPGNTATRTEFLYDGSDMVAEYNNSGTLIRRYIHGPGVDAPLVMYEGSGTTTRRWLHADERGSIIAISDASGNGIATFTYDPYGVPNDFNGSRFLYTGQMALPEVSLYHYKARAYSPILGRFLQTDPIGYAGGLNLYAYVGGDPVNFTDPSGMTPIGGAALGACPSFGAPACDVLEEVVAYGKPISSFSGRITLETDLGINFNGIARISLNLPDINRGDNEGEKDEKAKTCTGMARILKGNPNHIGPRRNGGQRDNGFTTPTFHHPITSSSAAVIPGQFPDGKSVLRRNLDNISGFVGETQIFNNVSDVVGGRINFISNGNSFANERIFLMTRFPNIFIVELQGAKKDLGIKNITLIIPSTMSCPIGTKEQ